jgi:hypothetical protein
MDGESIGCDAVQAGACGRREVNVGGGRMNSRFRYLLHCPCGTRLTTLENAAYVIDLAEFKVNKGRMSTKQTVLIDTSYIPNERCNIDTKDTKYENSLGKAPQGTKTWQPYNPIVCGTRGIGSGYCCLEPAKREISDKACLVCCQEVGLKYWD